MSLFESMQPKTGRVSAADVLQYFFLAGLLLASLSACGFQLRGSAALPEEMSITYVKGNRPYGTLLDDFSEALRMRGVTVADTSAEATAVLTITSDRWVKNVLSVNSSGKVLEFQLRQTINFTVTTADRVPLMEPQHITLERDYLFSSTQVLSKEREEKVVRRSIQRELVNLAMLRISAVR